MPVGAGQVSVLADVRAAVAPYALLLKLGLLLALVAGLVGYGYHRGAARWEGKYHDEAAAHAATKAAHARVLRELADAAREVARKAKAAEAQAKQERTANDKRYKDAQHDADQARHQLRDALRRGTGPVRLRPEWTCPAPGPGEGTTGPAAGGQDADADVRRARADAISDDIADHDHADRWITWLQAELISTRKACGVGAGAP